MSYVLWKASGSRTNHRQENYCKKSTINSIVNTVIVCGTPAGIKTARAGRSSLFLDRRHGSMMVGTIRRPRQKGVGLTLWVQTCSRTSVCLHLPYIPVCMPHTIVYLVRFFVQGVYQRSYYIYMFWKAQRFLFYNTFIAQGGYSSIERHQQSQGRWSPTIRLCV